MRPVASSRPAHRDREWQRAARSPNGAAASGAGHLALKAPGEYDRRLEDLDRRIEVPARRERARAALDGHLRAAEQLLAGPVSSQAAAAQSKTTVLSP
jgi:hypothetical protein